MCEGPCTLTTLWRAWGGDVDAFGTMFGCEDCCYNYDYDEIKAFYLVACALIYQGSTMQILYMFLILSEWFFHLLISKFYIIAKSTEYLDHNLTSYKGFLQHLLRLALCSNFHWFSQKICVESKRSKLFDCLSRNYVKIGVKFDLVILLDTPKIATLKLAKRNVYITMIDIHSSNVYFFCDPLDTLHVWQLHSAEFSAINRKTA